MGFEWIILEGFLVCYLVYFDIGGLSNVFSISNHIVQCVSISEVCPMCFDIGGLSNGFRYRRVVQWNDL